MSEMAVEQTPDEIPLPPDDISFAKELERSWVKLRKSAHRGHDHLVAYGIATTEAALSRGRTMLQKAELSTNFDWETDLRVAETLHEQNILWLQQFTKNLDRHYAFWEDEVRSKGELATKVAIAGLQIMFAINGAIAVGALNGLSNGSDQFKILYIVALIASAIGVLLTGAAHWALAETLGGFTNTVKAALATPRSMFKIKALSKFTKRLKSFRRSNLVIYAAILWAGLTVLGCTAFAVYLHLALTVPSPP